MIVGRKPSRAARVQVWRTLGIMVLYDHVMKSCATLKEFVAFLNETETDEFVNMEIARQPPLFPRTTILWRLASHASYLHGQKIRKIAAITPRLSPHGVPRRPKPLIKPPTLWQRRPSTAHKAGDSARFYEAVKQAVMLKTKTE